MHSDSLAQTPDFLSKLTAFVVTQAGFAVGGFLCMTGQPCRRTGTVRGALRGVGLFYGWHGDVICVGIGVRRFTELTSGSAPIEGSTATNPVINRDRTNSGLYF